MEQLPFEDDTNRWDDMGSYYEGDLASLDTPVQPVTDWPQFEQLPLGNTEAPNGWGSARDYWESHSSPEGRE